MGLEGISATDVKYHKVGLTFKYNPHYVSLIKQLPTGSRSWNPEEKRWEVEDDMLEKLLDLFKGVPIKYSGAKKALLSVSDTKDSQLEVNDKGEVIEKERKEYEVNAPEVDDTFLISGYKPKLELLPYQVTGVNFLSLRKEVILADKMGMGKSCQAILGWESYKMLHKDILPKALVITKSAIRHSWITEVAKFTESSAVLVEGTPSKRSKLLREDYDFYVMTYDCVKSHIDELKEMNFGCVILDEAHMIKNPASQRAKAIFKLDAKCRWALTGTPIINKPEESYSLLKWTRLMNSSFWSFKNKYCILDAWNNAVGYRHLDELKYKLNIVMLRRCKKPDIGVTNLIRYVQMSKAQKELYKTVEENVLTELENGADISYSIALTKLLRLRQITSHPACVGSDIKSSKEEELASILEEVIEDNGNKAVVFSQFIPAIDSLAKRFAKYNPVVVKGGDKNAQKKADKLQTDDNCKLFIGSLRACREGLTLTAANYCIFIDEDWSDSYNEQNEYRLIRVGQKQNVTIIKLRAENTVDTDKIENYLKRKRILVNEVIS